MIQIGLSRPVNALLIANHALVVDSTNANRYCSREACMETFSRHVRTIGKVNDIHDDSGTVITNSLQFGACFHPYIAIPIRLAKLGFNPARPETLQQLFVRYV
jgi:hypothetical protein